MILTCPQCETRYQADAAKFPAAGRNVRCAKCGNVWHQLGPEPEPDADTEILVQEQPPAPTPPEPAGVAAQPRAAAFAPAAAVVAESVPAPPPPPWLGRAAVVGGWVLLVGLVLVIGWAAVGFRDTIATWVPQTSSFYNAAGLPVRPKGLAFADVAKDMGKEDGQQVLSVTGKIVNRSNHELTVPLVRVGLLDADKREIYHWTFVPSVATLQPGAIARFRTRLSSPPPAAHEIELRFAKANE
ncbi:MAG: DUF3426 domain-containing protein [Rhizomicrobium sp.]